MTNPLYRNTYITNWLTVLRCNNLAVCLQFQKTLLVRLPIPIPIPVVLLLYSFFFFVCVFGNHWSPFAVSAIIAGGQWALPITVVKKNVVRQNV